MSDLGPLQYCLGIQVLHDPTAGTISLSQSSYIGSLLHTFHMDSCKGVSTPLPTSLKSNPATSSTDASTDFPFAQMLGSIHYLVTCTRLDICFASNYLSRFMHNP
ncbi:hypothetical protein KP509_06G015200 [Ceratopteris richardii]|uniref:Reverse transcriptase Ty1/copia-type domain-containing protein n=1 Tax=Ceratopteris richardii TaxID=49495 RepID=A0A8T2ULZ9_CERRI|nr:hypothetical protein KP509_06G015200 [Ceratopteris richardii]